MSDLNDQDSFDGQPPEYILARKSKLGNDQPDNLEARQAAYETARDAWTAFVVELGSWDPALSNGERTFYLPGDIIEALHQPGVTIPEGNIESLLRDALQAPFENAIIVISEADDGRMKIDISNARATKDRQILSAMANSRLGQFVLRQQERRSR